MSATSSSCPRPSYVVTDDKGNFKFNRLAPGKYKLKAWSERSKAPITQDVTIKAGKNEVDGRRRRPMRRPGRRPTSSEVSVARRRVARARRARARRRRCARSATASRAKPAGGMTPRAERRDGSRSQLSSTATSRQRARASRSEPTTLAESPAGASGGRDRRRDREGHARRGRARVQAAAGRGDRARSASKRARSPRRCSIQPEGAMHSSHARHARQLRRADGRPGRRSPRSRTSRRREARAARSPATSWSRAPLDLKPRSIASSPPASPARIEIGGQKRTIGTPAANAQTADRSRSRRCPT